MHCMLTAALPMTHVAIRGTAAGRFRDRNTFGKIPLRCDPDAAMFRERTSAMGHAGIEQKISASAPIGDSQQNSVTQSPRWQERQLPAAISERLHSSVLEAPLVSLHSARGATESLCHIILVSQALLNQSDHRIGFAHMVS
jgi:hypothetical protein